MSIRSRARRVSLAMLAGALGLALMIPVSALADTTGGTPTIGPAAAHDATIRLTGVTLSGKLIATVTVEFTCQPFESYDWDTGQTVVSTDGHVEGGGAIILQAQGRTIAWGQGDLGSGGHSTCDGVTTNTASIPVTPAVAPWKNGTAVIGASVYLADDNFGDSDYASTGPIAVKLSSK